MNPERISLLINNLPYDTITELLLIAAISPFNCGGRITPKGAALLTNILETKMTQREVLAMNDTNPVVLESSKFLIEFYKVSSNILETLMNPVQDTAKLAAKLAELDEEFFQVVEKAPVIKEILKFMAKNLGRA